jgi:hypothetical protein
MQLTLKTGIVATRAATKQRKADVDQFINLCADADTAKIWLEAENIFPSHKGVFADAVENKAWGDKEGSATQNAVIEALGASGNAANWLDLGTKTVPLAAEMETEVCRFLTSMTTNPNSVVDASSAITAILDPKRVYLSVDARLKALENE